MTFISKKTLLLLDFLSISYARQLGQSFELISARSCSRPVNDLGRFFPKKTDMSDKTNNLWQREDTGWRALFITAKLQQMESVVNPNSIAVSYRGVDLAHTQQNTPASVIHVYIFALFIITRLIIL